MPVTKNLDISYKIEVSIITGLHDCMSHEDEDFYRA